MTVNVSKNNSPGAGGGSVWWTSWAGIIIKRQHHAGVQDNSLLKEEIMMPEVVHMVRLLCVCVCVCEDILFQQHSWSQYAICSVQDCCIEWWETVWACGRTLSSTCHSLLPDYLVSCWIIILQDCAACSVLSLVCSNNKTVFKLCFVTSADLNGQSEPSRWLISF